MTVRVMITAAALAVAGCSGAPADNGRVDGNLSLRNLAASEVAATPRGEDRIEGTLVPTPSDSQSRHYLLRERRAVGGTIVAMLREKRGSRVAYARTEVDCAKRQFGILGVGASRASAEVATRRDGPLRSMTGLPLREELGAYICQRAGTPLAPAQAGSQPG